jgi:hypothetical protein
MPGKPKLYAHQVKILKYVKVGNAWRFANVVKSSGRMVRDRVLIAGRDTTPRAAISWSGTSTASVTARQLLTSRPQPKRPDSRLSKWRLSKPE